MNKMLGRIKWYKENKKNGCIIAGDDEVYYFTIDNYEEKISFKENELVKFIPDFGEINIAKEIEKIKEDIYE